MTTTTRTATRTTRDLAALRAEVKALKAQLALHEECLEITADALKFLQQKELKKTPASTKQAAKNTPASTKQAAKNTPASTKQAAKKASAPAKQGRPWSKLTKDEKSRCNKAVWANPKAHGFKDWADWEAKRTTMMFR